MPYHLLNCLFAHQLDQGSHNIASMLPFLELERESTATCDAGQDKDLTVLENISIST